MTRRQDRLNNRIIEVLVPVIESEMKDPRLQMLSLTRVQVNRDASSAMIFFTSHSTEYSHHQMEAALMRAKGFLRSVLANTLNLRYTPDLTFRYDNSFEESQRLEALFEQIAKERAENPPRFDEESQ